MPKKKKDEQEYYQINKKKADRKAAEANPNLINEMTKSGQKFHYKQEITPYFRKSYLPFV